MVALGMRERLASLACAALLLAVPAAAQVNLVTEANIRDAILGDESFSEDDLGRMDVNGDGKVDVADLALVAGVPVASFEVASSTVEEGSGALSLTVYFTSHFTGDLAYTVGGTSTAGSDYATPTGTVAVDGDQTTIGITLTDDTDIEPVLETLEVTLAYDAQIDRGYVPGAPMTHAVFISDNDAYWNGLMENNGASVQFVMRVTRSAGVTACGLVGNGESIIPTNGADPDWPSTTCSLTASTFDAAINNMHLPQEATALNAALSRSLVFSADAASEGEIVDPEGEISGAVTETISSATDPQYSRVSTGTFLLIRQIPEESGDLIPLEAVE